MINLTPINTEGIKSLCNELGRHTDFRKTFPFLRHAAFQQRVLAAHQIQHGVDSVGFLMATNPTPPFKGYGEKETLIMIYPEYQRQGIGIQVLNRICKDRESTFFVSSKNNPASKAFFKRHERLKLIDETDRYRVYSRK